MLPKACLMGTAAMSYSCAQHNPVSYLHTINSHFKDAVKGVIGANTSQVLTLSKSSQRMEKSGSEEGLKRYEEESPLYLRSSALQNFAFTKCGNTSSSTLLLHNQAVPEAGGKEAITLQERSEVEKMAIINKTDEMKENKIESKKFEAQTDKKEELREVSLGEKNDNGSKVNDKETIVKKITANEEREDKAALIKTRPVSCKRSEQTIPPPPTTCCMSGCPNCVWIQYADRLAEHYRDGGAKAIRTIEKEVEDPNLRAYILMEVRLKGLGK